MPGDQARFGYADQACLGKLCPARAQACRAADPGDSLKVTQAARTFFYIGFEVVICIDKASVALLLLALLGEKKFAGIEVLLHGVLQFPEQSCIAGKQACFEQIGLHGDVG